MSELRDRLAEAVEGHVARHDESGADDLARARSAADALLPIVYDFAAQVLRAAAKEQRIEADTVPDTDEGTHAEGHRCAADFLDQRAGRIEAQPRA